MNWLWIILKIIFRPWLTPESVTVDPNNPTPTPIPPAPIPSTDDPMLTLMIVIFDTAVELCPVDWLDRQIRKVQGAVVARWDVIKPYLNDGAEIGFQTIDAALKALYVAMTGRWLIQQAINVARGILDSLWHQLLPKVQAKLPSVKLAA